MKPKVLLNKNAQQHFWFQYNLIGKTITRKHGNHETQKMRFVLQEVVPLLSISFFYNVIFPEGLFPSPSAI